MLLTAETDCYIYSKYSKISQKKHKEEKSFQLLTAIFLGGVKAQELHFQEMHCKNKV